MRTHFCMLYCADKHKMACFVFTAYRCCLRALFLLSAALCCLAHTADLRQEEADDNQKQTRSTLQKTRPMRDTCIMLRRCEHGAITLQWPASSACDLSLSIYFCSPFSCCGDNSTKAYTQTNTNCRQAKEHEGQTADISHTSRVLQSLALATILR